MAATAYVLVRGVIAMASGKDVTGEQQQNYMRKRVLFQAVAIVIVDPDPGRRRQRPLGARRLVKLNKIYTRTGDGGSAGLVDGSRVSKSSLRMTAIGEVDEANAAIGVAIAALGDGRDRATSCCASRTTCSTSAPTSRRRARSTARCASSPSQVERLEREIDAMNAALEPLTSFILPSGSAGVAALHLARGVVRRAERAAVALNEAEPLNPHAARLPQPPVGPSVRRRALRRRDARAATCCGSRARPRLTKAVSYRHKAAPQPFCAVRSARKGDSQWRSAQSPSTAPSSAAAASRRRPTR